MRSRHWRRWYPRSWRSRYGEEYEQLLEDLAAEEPLSWQGELDVVQTGLALRRTYPGRRRRVLIATASVVLAIALGFGLGIGFRSSSIVGPVRVARICATQTEQSPPRDSAGPARVREICGVVPPGFIRPFIEIAPPPIRLRSRA